MVWPNRPHRLRCRYPIAIAPGTSRTKREKSSAPVVAGLLERQFSPIIFFADFCANATNSASLMTGGQMRSYQFCTCTICLCCAFYNTTHTIFKLVPYFCIKTACSPCQFTVFRNHIKTSATMNCTNGHNCG